MPSTSAAQHNAMEAQSLSDAEIAYMAGLFDGEGTVAIYESWSLRRGVRRPTWIYQAQIANCNLAVLHHVLAKIGGSVVKKSKGRENWRQGYAWRICGPAATDFLRLIRPYAIVKAKEIDEAVAFRALCTTGWHRQTEDQVAKKRAIANRLKELKRAVS